MARLSWLRGFLKSRSKRSDRATPKRYRPAWRRWLHLEVLEDRILPSTVTWINLAGGGWDTAGNWRDDQGINRLPGPNDDAVINVAGNVTITHSQTSVCWIGRAGFPRRRHAVGMRRGQPPAGGRSPPPAGVPNTTPLLLTVHSTGPGGAAAPGRA